MKVSFSNIAINSIATALPLNKLNINSLGKQFGDNEVKRIIASTGIKSVGVAKRNMKVSDLFFAASTNLLNKLNISPSSIDAIVVVSQTHDAIMPATSVMLQHRFGLNKNAVAF